MSDSEKLSGSSRCTHLNVKAIVDENVAVFFVYLWQSEGDRFLADEAEALRSKIAEFVKAEVA